MHIQDLAARLEATVDAQADAEIHGASTIEEAGESDVTFLANPHYVRALRTSRAAAVFVGEDFEEEVPPTLIRTKDPYLTFAKALHLFYEGPRVAPGIHPTAVLGEDIVLGDDVSIGPYVVIGDRVRVGDGTVIFPHVVIYEEAEIGPGVVLHSFSVVRERVKLRGGVILQNGAVVGADGYGFAPQPDKSYYKILQAGTVELAEDVEVQANACVDRATVGATTVGRGTKIDNLVQVGHGCHVGEDALLCGQSGIAGSTEIGHRTILTGQVGVAGHCRVADDVILTAQTGVANGVKEPGIYGGSPCMPVKTYRQWAALRPKLPELFKRVKKLERQLAALKCTD